MQPWYRVVTPRKEVRDGRSFHPDEFAIALEQVVNGSAPEDYRDPAKFFARTCFTRALREHSGMVLRRLSGRTENAAPVLTLVTQFGGGKTHTLTALYHLANNGQALVGSNDDVAGLVRDAGLATAPKGRVAVFVGNAWDPQDGRETPWIDLARQLAGDAGVALLGKASRTVAPGTEALGRVFQAAGGPVLLLFDEVLNFVNRHKDLAEQFYSFLHNMTVSITGMTHGAAVISLPRSQVEMGESDQMWQDRITKVVRRVAKDLIANDESEISEVIRRRLFEDLGQPRVRREVAGAYAAWCHERRTRLPPEWMTADAGEARPGEYLRRRFEACYPFHPATLSVFQRKWQSLRQFQQTRGTLAMFAQWISWAAQDHFRHARAEPLLTLGWAPLHMPEFRAAILGQLGEPRLNAAIEADMVGDQSHARALDADTRPPLDDIHRRVGTAILFESSGGQSDKLAHLPELWFALGGPDVETTSIDSAAAALESRGYYLRKPAADGYRFGFKPTLKKVVNDRRASLADTEVEATARGLVQRLFERRPEVPLHLFPLEGAAVPDQPKLGIAVPAPDFAWKDEAELRQKLGPWTRERGTSPRLYPGAVLWAVRSPGRGLAEKVEAWMAWKRVAAEIADGTLGGDFEDAEKKQVRTEVAQCEAAAAEEVWAGYRILVLADPREPEGLQIADLGPGHGNDADSLCARILASLRSRGLLNESPGASYLERRWPEAFRASGAWPLNSLRQAFFTGGMERLKDPEAYLRTKVPEFVEKKDFGLGSGPRPDGTWVRIWFGERPAPEEITFDGEVLLLTARAARAALKPEPLEPPPGPQGSPTPTAAGGGEPPVVIVEPPTPADRHLIIEGPIPVDVWNRLGLKVVTKLKAAGGELGVRVEFDLRIDGTRAAALEGELKECIRDLGLGERLTIR